ncbi:WD repeat-containing protein 36-like [Littorina saxatilis]|uniref:WD repeat-containing protein 36-like n=1 Tax=Littorina saxatilis TaxID=31220 RepID=UPI0038B651DB
MSASKIFTGYRAVGLVSTDVPLAVRYHKKHRENYAVTSVGRAFHVYNCSKLGIVSVSDLHPDPITVMVTSERHIFTACGNTIRCFDKGRKVIHVYEGHSSDVTLLLPFGRHLISFDSTGHVIVWDVHSEGIYLTMEFEVKNFEITAATHPHGYMDKVVLGSRQGPLQLWNIKHDKLVYTFNGWGQQVTVLEQSPAVNVLAVGLADGRILLHNLKLDETLMKFTQDWGPVTAISFRTDGNPTMVTGSAAGHMAFWDLERKSLISQTLEAHGKAVSGLHCLPKEPIMVTSSGDNTLKVWIFDQADGGVRLLRMREGHSSPPNYLRHYGNGQKILCAGQDSTMRMFSTVHDKHNSSLGRASFNKSETKRTGLKNDQHKMPPVTCFTAEWNRESDWDNVVACHRGLRMVTTWSTQRSTMGKHKLDCKRFHHGGQHRNTTAQAVDISSCGNFAVVGYSSGHVDVYNMESGKHRGSFGEPKAHSSCVRGVAFDAYNALLITAGSECDIKFWRFGSRDKARILLKEVKTPCSISRMVLHRDSKMLALVLEDFTVSVLDLDTLKVVRNFTGHTNTITDLTFSADGRWLITASMDCSVCTWSMVHGRLIDCFAADSAVTSVSMSPTEDFLATSHVGDLGIYLWANKTLFSFVSLQPLPEHFEPQVIHMPTTALVQEDVESEDEEKMEYESAEFKSPEQMSEELITLSLLPTSRWLNLLYLDVIKLRNKPKEPPKVPKSAPFFLPTIAGLKPEFVKSADTAKDDEAESRILGRPDLHAPSEFAQLLLKSSGSADYAVVLERLKVLGSFGIDMDIRSVEGEEELSAFLDFALSILETNRDFDLVNGYVGLFIKIHHDSLQDNQELAEKMEKILSVLKDAAQQLDDEMKQSLCLGKYMCSAKLG